MYFLFDHNCDNSFVWNRKCNLKRVKVRALVLVIHVKPIISTSMTAIPGSSPEEKRMRHAGVVTGKIVFFKLNSYYRIWGENPYEIRKNRTGKHLCMSENWEAYSNSHLLVTISIYERAKLLEIWRPRRVRTYEHVSSVMESSSSSIKANELQTDEIGYYYKQIFITILILLMPLASSSFRMEFQLLQLIFHKTKWLTFGGRSWLTERK